MNKAIYNNILQVQYQYLDSFQIFQQFYLLDLYNQKFIIFEMQKFTNINKNLFANIIIKERSPNTFSYRKIYL